MSASPAEPGSSSTVESHDIVIVGAGPGGLSAAVQAQKNQLDYILLEKTDHIADTIFCYPKGKPVMAEPSVIPVMGDMWMEPDSREAVLQRWQEIADQSKVTIRFNQDVTGITKQSDGSFAVKTAAGTIYNAKRVVYAAGTQGNPNSLRPTGRAPGEDLPHVFNRLKDPALFVGREILVVGGGDAAIETGIALAPQNQVTIVVRKPEFSPEAKNSLVREAFDLQSKGALKILFKHEVDEIQRGTVMLKPRTAEDAKANFVFVKIGTQKPRRFLESTKVEFVSADPKAPPRLKDDYETSVPGLYLIGAVCGRGADLIKNAINQGVEVIEHILEHKVVPADEAVLLERLEPVRDLTGTGTVAERISALVPRAPLLAGGSMDQLREVLLFSRFHIKNAGEAVYRQGDYSTSLYVILDGAIEVFIKSRPNDISADGEKVSTKQAGEFFGEMNLISARVRSGTPKAKTRCVLWEIDRKAALKFIQRNTAAKEIIDKTFIVNAFQTYLFPDVSRDALHQLADRAKVLPVFEPGKLIIKEGDAGDAFYFIRSGIVKVMCRTERPDRGVCDDTIDYLSAGQYFGEMAIFSGEPRSATVAAVDPVECVTIFKEDFLNFVDDNQLRNKFNEIIAQRKKANEQLANEEWVSKALDFMTGAEVAVSENALLIDENRCIHCDNCVKACESVHPDGHTRIKRTGQKFANVLIANSCRHCENPLCMTDCPPGDAILRHPSGEVYIVKDRCIACGNCANNCPYDNIFMYHPEEEAGSESQTKLSLLGISADSEPAPVAQAQTETARGFAIKCDLCQGIDGGPACVRSCPTGALERLRRGAYDEKIISLAGQRRHEIS